MSAHHTYHMFSVCAHVFCLRISYAFKHVICLRITHIICFLFTQSHVVCFLVMTVAFTATLNRRCTTLCVYTERALLRISSTQNLQHTKAICKTRLHFSPATKGKQSTSWERTFRAWRYSMASKKCRNRRNTKHI